jgi:uncharacterized protein (TIGR03067 family)
MRRAFVVALALSVFVVAARADDDDPEPPGGSSLRALRGKWTVTRRIFRGKEMKTNAAAATYEFDGDKVTVDTGKLHYVAKVKVDAKKKPATLELSRDDAKGPSKMAFKIEKGELYLALTPPNGGLGDVKGEDVFKGETRPLMVLKREKK